MKYEVVPSYNESCPTTCVSTNDLISLQSEKTCPTTSVHNRDLYWFRYEKVVPQHVYTIITSISLHLKGVPQHVYKIKSLPVYYLKKLENSFATDR